MDDWVGSSSPMKRRRVVETRRCIPRAGSRRDGLDGSGHFKTVQAAINRVPTKNKKRVIIYVKKGVYTEKVRIPSNKKYITLKGESASLTTIQWGDTASTLGKNGKPLSTYGSASVAVEADNFIALDISFKVNKYIIKLTLYFLSLNSHLFHNVYFIEHSSPPTFRSSWPPSRCSSNSRRQSCLLSLQFLWRPRHPLWQGRSTLLL